MVDVSCIIINFNTSKYTIDCIDSILKNSTKQLSIEIVVVDNASEINDFKNLKRHINDLNGQVRLVRSKQNIGFGAGNMLGVQYCEACKYYAFINNDTLQVSDNCLYELKSFMENHPDVAVCSPQMLDEDKNFRVTIDHFSSIQREILRRPLLEFLFPKTYLDRKKRYDTPTKVHYIQGSFMFIDAKDFNQIGGFDTNLFLYYEESDVCRRLLKEKKKYTYLIPELEYIHYKGASTSKNILIKIEQKLSLLYYIRKHYGWFQHKILLFYYIFRYFFTSIIKPKYWKLFFILLGGAPISKSLKQRQKINQLQSETI
ncbi:glycosyltransferase family 2 protein [Aquimarina algicola]|uniref:Glycosyltransferase family 2 protein n=1 Tax=Aquimarina algicola TaxID=2589995 RepID=A0A504J8D3_9FLAO|nr:glycosyltransferase family 2 protein [Aquimarina algicola]TPN84782.1 glycosyltransferase family 2 protein [Aquimarina algicola]